MLRTLLLVFMLSAVSACSDNSSSSSAAAVSGPPLPASSTGQLIFEVSGNVSNTTVQGYVVGSQDELTVEQASNGTYYIDNIPPGNVDIVVTGALVVSTQLTADASVGIRKNNVFVAAGSSSSPGAMTLYPLGSISGVVKRSGSNNHEGIFVSIPGTDFGEVRTTDAEGRYSFADVPAGEHRLLFQSDGYREGRIENIEVKPSRATQADELFLTLSTGPDGSLVINNGATYSNSLTVSLALNVSADAELMKISEDINFSGLAWEPVRTYRSWTFGSAGPKTLYVKFSDANGLETSPAKAEITIDLFSDGLSAFTPGFSLVSSSAFSSNAAFQLTGIQVPPQATSMLVYDTGAMDNAVWVNPATTASFSFPNTIANCGTRTLAVKFKTATGMLSETATQTATVNCWKDAVATGAPTVNSSIGSETWTGSRLLLWGGSVPTGYTSQTYWTHGYQFDATTGTWSSLPSSGQPSTRNHVGTAYTPDKLFLWGGSTSGDCILNDGAIYTESTQLWSTLPTLGAPTGRCPGLTFGYLDPNDSKYKVIVWGGYEAGVPVKTGGIYSVPDNSWSTLNDTNSPSVPASSVRTVFGNKLYVIGPSGTCNTPDSYGKTYTLSTGTWGSTASPGSLLDTSTCDSSVRGFFDGSRFYIFTIKTVSQSKQYTIKAAIYDPSLDSWSALPLTNGPQNRTNFSLVYTGTKIVVLSGTGGGFDGGELPSIEPSFLADGYSYDIASQTWTYFSPASTRARSGARAYHLAGAGIFWWHGQYFTGGHQTSTITTLLASPP